MHEQELQLAKLLQRVLMRKINGCSQIRLLRAQLNQEHVAQVEVTLTKHPHMAASNRLESAVEQAAQRTWPG